MGGYGVESLFAPTDRGWTVRAARSADVAPPCRLTLSLYGTTEECNDGMTRRAGLFRSCTGPDA